MKICKRCFREFDEEDAVESGLPMALTDIMLQDIGADGIDELCPRCREELGMMNLSGFEQ